MSTATATFRWTADTGGWTSDPAAAKIHYGHVADDGHDLNGCLQAYCDGNNDNETGYWELSGTWADIFSINAGDTVTAVRIYSLWHKCAGYTNVDNVSLSNNDSTTVNGLYWANAGETNSAELWAGYDYTTTTAWTEVTAGSNQSVPAGDQAGDTSILFRLYVDIDCQNSPSAEVRWDDLIIEVTYTEAAAGGTGMAYYRYLTSLWGN